jgi:acetoin utilization deacetylase AcuC-like enzyme
MKTIPVFYTPKMVADSRSMSPSAAKPEKVVASWNDRGFPIDVIEPTPITVEQLKNVHDGDYVDDIFALRTENGFGNKSAEVASSLLYTNGSMLSAARHAFATKEAASAPCSGFHHAGVLNAEGYCTFNGLMVAAKILLDEGAKKIGILDFDMHYGNGTDQIIDASGLRSDIRHVTAGAYFTEPEQASTFFMMLPEIVSSMNDCDVVLYQAGADPHINDPYGGWLTTEQLRVRDGVVFDVLKSLGVPVAWNLAGGYQTERDGSIPKVLEIHDNTMRECVRVYLGV